MLRINLERPCGS